MGAFRWRAGLSRSRSTFEAKRVTKLYGNKSTEVEEQSGEEEKEKEVSVTSYVLVGYGSTVKQPWGLMRLWELLVQSQSIAVVPQSEQECSKDRITNNTSNGYLFINVLPLSSKLITKTGITTGDSSARTNDATAAKV